MSFVIEECVSVLKPGGLLFFRDYGLYDMTMLRFPPEQRVGFREYMRLDGTLSYFFSLDIVRDLFLGAGFIEDIIFCKSILHEYTVKMNLGKPTYITTSIPVFKSSLVCDGTTYTGAPGRNKKEAEQMAARTFIESILANSNTSTFMSQIIKSKGKLYSTLHKGSSSDLS